MDHTPDPTLMSLTDLLQLRNAIDREIIARGHARTATSLAGELMERVVAHAYGGELAPPTTKSVDVITPGGQTIQVKVRSLPRGATRFWSFDDFQFDLAVVILMDRDTSDILWAREIERAEAESMAARQSSGSWRIRMSRAQDAGVDVTRRLRDAYAGLR